MAESVFSAPISLVHGQFTELEDEYNYTLSWLKRARQFHHHMSRALIHLNKGNNAPLVGKIHLLEDWVSLYWSASSMNGMCDFSQVKKNKELIKHDSLESVLASTPQRTTPVFRPSSPTYLLQLLIHLPPLADFRQLNTNDVQKLISSSPNRSCCLDLIPTVLLKRFIDFLVSPITAILNLSLSSWFFPSAESRFHLFLT